MSVCTLVCLSVPVSPQRVPIEWNVSQWSKRMCLLKLYSRTLKKVPIAYRLSPQRVPSERDVVPMALILGNL